MRQYDGASRDVFKKRKFSSEHPLPASPSIHPARPDALSGRFIKGLTPPLSIIPPLPSFFPAFHTFDSTGWDLSQHVFHFLGRLGSGLALLLFEADTAVGSSLAVVCS